MPTGTQESWGRKRRSKTETNPTATAPGGVSLLFLGDPPAKGQAVGLLLKEPLSAAEEWQPPNWQWTQFCSSFLQDCTWRNGQREPASPGPWLEMVIAERKESLVTSGQCQTYFLLYQGDPQERPVLSSTPGQAQIIVKFSMQPESTYIAAWSLLGSGFAWTGSQREARIG